MVAVAAVGPTCSVVGYATASVVGCATASMVGCATIMVVCCIPWSTVAVDDAPPAVNCSGRWVDVELQIAKGTIVLTINALLMLLTNFIYEDYRHLQI